MNQANNHVWSNRPANGIRTAIGPNIYVKNVKFSEHKCENGFFLCLIIRCSDQLNKININTTNEIGFTDLMWQQMSFHVPLKMAVFCRLTVTLLKKEAKWPDLGTTSTDAKDVSRTHCLLTFAVSHLHFRQPVLFGFVAWSPRQLLSACDAHYSASTCITCSRPCVGRTAASL